MPTSRMPLLALLALAFVSPVVHAQVVRVTPKSPPKGKDAGAKLERCVQKLAATGGVCDATALTGTWPLAGMTIAGRSNLTFLFGDTEFRVSAPIVLDDVHHVRWAGRNSATNNNSGTRFLWTGPATGAMFDLRDVDHSSFEDFSVIAQAIPTPAPLQYAFQLRNVEGGNSPTARIFRNVLVLAQTLGSSIVGTGFFWDAESPHTRDENNDLDTLYNVHVRDYTDYAYRITGGNSFTHTFYNCSFLGVRNGLPYGAYGVHAVRGSFQWYGGAGGGYNVESDFYVQDPHAPVLISGCNLEHSSRLLRVPFSTSAIPILVVGCRFSSDHVAEDGRVVWVERGGGVQLIGNLLARASHLSVHFKGASASTDTTALASGNTLETDLANPFTDEWQGRWILEGNTREWGGRYRIPDRGSPSTGVLGFGAVVTPGQGDRLWCAANGPCVTSPFQGPPVGPLELTGLTCTVATAPGTGKGWTMTVEREGAPTALTCTIAGDDSACSIAGQVAFAAAERLTLHVQRNGSTAATAALACAASTAR